MKSIILLLLATIITITSFGQKITIDARVTPQLPKQGHLIMGNPGQQGKEILVNNKYLTLGGKAIIPVMGEVHPTRVKRENWESTILKMKANGINIIAFYIFWIHHEEIEGEFNWSDNYDIRAFVELCKKHQIWAYPRLGPWCHGEVRNGALPDWLMKKEELKLRSNDSSYLFYAERLYREIAQQLEGLYYKDGGPIIGVQLENEYWRGKNGEKHILWLKQTAKKYGIDVPLYTVTGWRAASVPENEAIPLWGGYPAAPWNTNVKKIERNDSYLFKKPINDESIGHKENNEGYKPDYSLYPYLTCELGIGNQVSEHRRPVINPIDGVAIATSNVASGSNLPGYYVFAGGLNPVGKLSTLEEDQLESGYWNEYPDISYDFQAAISEAGEIKPAYHELKALHYFLNQFGQQLALMQPVIPTNTDEWDNLQYAIRTDGSSGFLFVSNYYRGHTKTSKKNVQFAIQFPEEELVVPKSPVDILDSTLFIWPVNFKLGDATLKYATAQLISKIKTDNTIDWYFKASKNIDPNFMFLSDNIQEISIKNKKVSKNSKNYFVTEIQAGLANPIRITMKDGSIQRVFILSEKESKNFWYFKENGNEWAYLSTGNLIIDKLSNLHIFSTHTTDTLIALNTKLSVGSGNKNCKKLKNTPFPSWVIQHANKQIDAKVEKTDLLDKCEWLTITPENYTSKKNMYHKQFFKEFNLENTADIRKANLFLLGGSGCKIRINNKWLNQTVTSNIVNELDLTGYLQRGNNRLLLDFPYINKNKAYAAMLEVEYYNANKECFTTDSTWLTVEQYKIPAPWDGVKNKTVPKLQNQPEEYANMHFTPYRYEVPIDLNTLKQDAKTYLRINYTGDKAQCRIGKNLVADNFNNGTTWTICISDLSLNESQPLVFELEPYDSNKSIYLEKNPETVKSENPEIINIEIEVENVEKFIIQYYPN